MDWAVAIPMLAGFGLGCAFVGWLAKAWTGSVLAGVFAGLVAAAAGALHTMYALVTALGEYEEDPSGYERLVDDAYVPLLIGYMLAPAIVVAGVVWAWRRLRRTRGLAPRRPPER
ncbi:MAG TPA: hypothetical protein VF529_22935 [Solirubrobacteraceae bacterium]|jgi:hypothetical protein